MEAGENMFLKKGKSRLTITTRNYTSKSYLCASYESSQPVRLIIERFSVRIGPLHSGKKIVFFVFSA